MNPTIPSGTELRRAALKRVEGYVCKDRQATHGDAEDNFRQIAAYWALYKGYPFTPGDVAAMMALVKIARMKTSPDYVDNWDDLAGYAICGAGLADKKRMSEGSKPQTNPTEIPPNSWICNECFSTYPKEVAPWIRDNTSIHPRFVCVKCGDPTLR